MTGERSSAAEKDLAFGSNIGMEHPLPGDRPNHSIIYQIPGIGKLIAVLWEYNSELCSTQSDPYLELSIQYSKHYAITKPSSVRTSLAVGRGTHHASFSLMASSRCLLAPVS